jgi:hypothetical protein
MPTVNSSSNRLPPLYDVYTVGEEVIMIGDRWEGMEGIVIRETDTRVLIASHEGFLHWFELGDVLTKYGWWW